MTENQRRGEDPSERLVAVQQVLRILAHDHIQCLEQSLHITIFIERCSQIRHDDIPHEHDFFLGEINQHGIMCFTATSRDQLELRSADVQFCCFVDRSVGLVAQEILRAESVSEELLREDTGTVGLLLELLLIVLSPIKLGTRVQPAEVRMTTDMIPVGVSNKHGCERRQSWRKGLQNFVCTLCEVRTSPRVNADELMPVF